MTLSSSPPLPPRGALLAAFLGLFLLVYLFFESRLELLGITSLAQALEILSILSPFLILVLFLVIFPPLLLFLPPSRRWVIGRIVIGAALLGAGFAILGLNWEAWQRRSFHGIGTIAILAAAGTLGIRLLLLPFLRPPDHVPLLDRLLWAMGLGLVAISTMTFLLGWAGGLNRLTACGMIFLAIGLGGREFLRHLYGWLRGIPSTVARLTGIDWMALGLLGGMMVALLPMTRMPPLDYDVLEYHLQLPKEYLEAGKIVFLPHNVFSGFPQGYEMFVLLAFYLGGLHEGIGIAHLLHFAFLPLLLGGVAWTVRRLVGDPYGKTAGLLASLLLLACHETMGLTMVQYVELAMGAYMALATLAVSWTWQAKETRDWRWGAILAGLFAGASCGCKYTALPLIGVPIALLFLYRSSEFLISRREQVRAFLIVMVMVGLILAPWLLKNTITTQNPLYPLWNHFFGVEGWTEEQEIRFRNAHRSSDHSLGECLRQLHRVMIGGRSDLGDGKEVGIELGIMTIWGMPGLLLLEPALRRRIAIPLLLWLGVAFLFWFFFTHRLERFFYPGAIVATMLSGMGLAALLGLSGRLQWFGRGWSGFFLILLALQMGVVIGCTYGMAMWDLRYPTLSYLLGFRDPDEMLEAGYMPWSLKQWMEEKKPKGRVLLIGSADPFWLPSNVEYAVVFNRHPLWDALKEEKNAEAVRRRLRQRGITHLYINWFELARLHATYDHAYCLTPREQDLFYDLLLREICDYEPLAPRWNLSLLLPHHPYLRRLVTDYTRLFPDMQSRGRYTYAPYEIYELVP